MNLAKFLNQMLSVLILLGSSVYFAVDCASNEAMRQKLDRFCLLNSHHDECLLRNFYIRKNKLCVSGQEEQEGIHGKVIEKEPSMPAGHSPFDPAHGE